MSLSFKAISGLAMAGGYGILSANFAEILKSYPLLSRTMKN